MKAAFFSVAAMDYFPQQKKYFPGGNSLNQAIRFKKAGFDSIFIGALGTDAAGDEIQELLKRNKVDISHLYRLEGITACNQMINDEKGERFGIEGAWKDGVYGNFLLSQKDWNYIESCEIWSTHVNGPNFETCIAKKKNNFLAVDFLHYTDYKMLTESSKEIDIAYFGGVERQHDDLFHLSKELKILIVLTLGNQGSFAFKDGKEYFQKALPVDKVIDTTGCGDAYQAAFSACYYKTNDISKALLEGALAGREVCKVYGGTGL